MKNLATIFAISLIFQANAQELIIKSSHIDSLIFAGINTYRASLGKPQTEKFENGPMRKISYELTEANSNRQRIEHSSGDKVFVGYNAECIYRHESTGEIQSAGYPTESDLQFLANKVVQAWIDSPNHNWIISFPLAYVATVTTVIKKGAKSFSITASYHAKNKNF